MNTPRRLLQSHEDVALFDDATTARLEKRAAAGLPEHALMARAGVALLRLARAVAPHARRVWVAAGPGNNGGDGLLLAALLQRGGVRVRVTHLGRREARTLPADARWALGEAQSAGVEIGESLPADDLLATFDLCVDAIFGFGQKRGPEPAFTAAIDAINRCPAPVLSIDAPTGLSTDAGRQFGDAVVRATHTLVLLTAKPGQFTGAGREAAGQLWFDGLGVTPSEDERPTAVLTGSRAVAACLPRRRHLANKGSFGDVHVAGGAAGMVGASLLAAHAASLAGAGRVLVHAHSSDAGGVLPVDVRHPELMLRPAGELQPAVRADARATVVAGCGGGADVVAELPGCLSNASRLVLDADALNAIARDTGLRAHVRRRGDGGRPTILTPHPLEAARLLGTSADAVQADRFAAARRLAAELGAVVVLKGSGTLVAAPDGRVAVNPTGDARLATAGTGDVLAGWIGGLWSAQPAATAATDQAFEVARAAAWLHGRACDFAIGDRLPIVAGELAALMARAAATL